MARSLSIAPCESFSPALLRSEPAALASWIRYRLAKWLLNAPVRKSGWTYPSTSHYASGNILVGRDQATFALEREDQKVEIVYHFAGAGFMIGSRIPFTMMQTMPSPKGSNDLFILGEVTGDGDQENLDRLGITNKNCMLIDLRTLLDAEVTHRGHGIAGSALLLGVSPSLQADFSRLAAYSRRLSNLANQPISRQTVYTPGLRSEWNPTNVMGMGGVDPRAIYEDVEIIFSHHDFRAVLFFGGLQGTANTGSVAFMGQITNAANDDKGALPKAVSTIGKALLANLNQGSKGLQAGLIDQAKGMVAKAIPDANVRKAVSFGLGEIGKSKKEIEADLIGKGKGFIDSKLPDGFGKKAFDFAVDHIGKSKKEIEKDLFHDVVGGFKGKIDGKLPDGFMKKVVDFGIDHAGENLKELKASAVGVLKDKASELGKAYWDAHQDQLLQYKFPALATAAIAIASNKNARTLAGQFPSVERAIFSELGDKLNLPPVASTFLKDNAAAIVSGDWKGVAQVAISNELGGGGFGNQAAAVALEKLTGQPVTSTALKLLGGQGLKTLFDGGAPVVASGKAGDAAVTGVSATHVNVKGPTGLAKVLSHGDFFGAYDMVASPGVQ